MFLKSIFKKHILVIHCKTGKHASGKCFIETFYRKTHIGVSFLGQGGKHIKVFQYKTGKRVLRKCFIKTFLRNIFWCFNAKQENMI